MGPATTALTYAVVLPLVIASLAYWWWVMRSGEDRVRRWVEGRFQVSITRGPRGHWDVHGARPWWARIGLELLQLVYFMVAMLGWALGMGVGLALLFALQALRLDG